MRLVNKDLIEKLKQEANGSKRGRTIHRFHKLKDPVQRMINVIRSGSYVQPHAHMTPPKFEVFLMLEGRAAVVEFTATGRIGNCQIIDNQGDTKGVELAPKSIHTVIALSKYAVMYEIKEGPYNGKKDKVFADFAPSEDRRQEADKYFLTLKEELKKRDFF